MFGMGVSELVIVVFIVLVLFGAPVLTFLLGYTLGKKSSVTPRPPTSAPSTSEEPKELPE